MDLRPRPRFLHDTESACADLARAGYALLDASLTARVAGAPLQALTALAPQWNDLPADAHLRDGGHYRRRRHGSFVHTLATHTLHAVPHRAHWQPTTYNALHGGIERWFEPLPPALEAAPAWGGLLIGLGELFNQVRPAPQWFIEAHPFRIDTTDGVGRPTPEGAHRDGVDFVAVILVERQAVRGGETRVFEADGPHGVRFTLVQPWSAMLLDDLSVIHESTPIQPDGDAPHRDTLVLTYRRGGFQDPEPAVPRERP